MEGHGLPFTSFGALEAVFLAARGITGPLEVFEGNKGFMDSIAGPFEIDWENEDLERVRRTFLKRYNAEIHSQSALEAMLELREAHGLNPGDVERVDLDTFQVAYDIIGGGEEGAKKEIRTKEQADHSLPYLLAVALLDGQVMPEQFAPDRIARPGCSEAAAEGRGAPGGGPVRPLPRGACVPGARAALRRRDPRGREV